MATLLGLVMDIRCEQERSALGCGDGSGEHGSLGDALASIGPGLFDDSLASIPHLKKPGGAFEFDIALDGIPGNPSGSVRRSGSASGSEDLLAPVLRRRFRREPGRTVRVRPRGDSRPADTGV